MAERLSAKSAWKLNSALKKSAATKPTKVGTARVTRRDSDGSVWVRLPGSNVDTPVNGQILSDAQVGDSVSVRIENGRLSLMGNASTPSVGQQQVNTTVRPVRQTADNALETASTAQTAAELATSYAAAAQQSATDAETYARQALGSAQDADRHATEAKADALAANTAAHGALLGLSTVEDVVDTLTWITKHGTMTLTTDTEVDPSKVYFVPDASGQYVVGGNTYSIVQNPTTEGLSGYYELTIDKSVENYIATHVAVTNEGLWLTPTSSNGYRVLIATGAGTTYTTAGTYIIDASGTVVAQFTTTNARVGREGGSHVNIETDGVSIHGSDASVGVTISATSGVESVYGTERLNGNALRAYADDAGYTTRDYDQRSFLVGSGRSLTAGSPLHVVLKEGSSTGTQEWIVRFVAGTSKSVTLNPLNKAGYTLSYGGGRNISLRRTSAAESQDLTQYYSLYEVRYYEQLHAPMVSMGSTDSSGAPFTTRLGEGLLADGDHQAVFGRFNESDPNDQYALIIGNGTDDDSRSNALTVDWDGQIQTSSPVIDRDGPHDSGHYHRGLLVTDKDGSSLSDFGSHRRSNGAIDTQIETFGNNATNWLLLRVNEDGTKAVLVSDPAAWRAGLGLDTAGALVTVQNCTMSSNAIWKSGNVVTVAVDLKLSATLTSPNSRRVGTVPSGYRPLAQVFAPTATDNAATIGGIYAGMFADGGIYIYNRSGQTVPTSASIVFTFTYVTA